MKWLKKIFSKNQKTMAKRYDIRVSDPSATGGTIEHIESGVMANSKEELKSIYQMCGQTIQILREYEDETSKNYGKQKLIDPSSVHLDTSLGGGTGFMKVSQEEQEKINKFIQNSNNNTQNEELKKPTQTPTVATTQQKPIQNPIQQVQPPKYFSIGGVKCKMENGKFYQKQWMKLSEEEASEIRIVSDKNNKICPLTNKHIEVLKWVVTEDSENNDSTINEKG